MMRRRALLAASQTGGGENLPPESTEFEFPLYLNTKVIEKTEDFLYRSRGKDEILNQLRLFYIERTEEGESISSELLSDYPVYIDGYQIKSARVFSSNIENIQTDNDYGGGYSEIYIGIEAVSELLVECYR